MTVATAIRTRITRGPEAWVRPELSMPKVLASKDLEPLGQDLRTGRYWYKHATLGELAERLKPLNSTEHLPDLPMVEEEIDGERAWRVMDLYAPGSFARLAESPVRAPKPPAPHRGIDAIEATFLGAPQPERIFTAATRSAAINPLSPAGTPPVIKAPEPAVRGAEAVMARLRKAGSDVHLSTDGQHVILTAPGGRPAPGVVELFSAAQPLILGYLRGDPLACSVAAHGKTDNPAAVTLLIGGAPACARHASDPSTAA